MPMQPNSLDALKKLLATSGDLNADDPSGMVQGRLKQEDTAEEDFRRYQNASSDGLGVSGATPSTFKNLADTLNASPNFGTQAVARKDAISAANDKALQAGFRGDPNIAGPASGGGDALGEHLYANLGDRSGDSPAQMAGKSASAVEAMKTQMPLAVAHANAQGNIDQANVEARGKMDLERLKRQGMQDSFNQFLKLKPGAQAPAQAPGQVPQTGAPPQGAPQAQAKTSPSWLDFIMGKGPNSLGAATDAFSERQKYGMMTTPMSDMIQNESFGNLEQLQAQFPGVRGFSYLLPKLKEHQSHFGQGLQTPQASHDRLGNMDQILGELEQDMADPSSHMAQAATGEWHFTSTPAAVQRALAAIHDTRRRFQDAQGQIKQQYPELGAQAPGAAPGGASGRFTRVE